MKRLLIISATVTLLFILQSLPAYRLSDMHFSLSLIRLQADISCIFCVYLGMRESSLLRGTFMAFVVGMFANCFAPSAMRIYAFLAPACFILTYASNVAFYFKRLESYIGIVFVMSFLYNFAFFKLMSIASPDFHLQFFSMFLPMLLQAFLNAFFGAIIFTFFDWISEAHEQAHQKRFRF